MCRAGFSKTRSHRVRLLTDPPLHILLKPTTKNAGSPPAWCMTACYSLCVQFSTLRPGILWKCLSLFVAITISFSIATPAISKSISSSISPFCLRVAYNSAEILQDFSVKGMNRLSEANSSKTSSCFSAFSAKSPLEIS